MSIGLKRGTVRLEPHDPAWDQSAREVMAALREILGSDARDIQHIGSTAIQGILAKPIVDIAVGVEDLEDMRGHDPELAARGFLFRGEDVPGQLLYVLAGPEDIRTHHIHTVIWGQKDWNNYINFRDYLNCHPDMAQRYSQLKEKLWGQYGEDRRAYTQSKQALIDEILALAGKWRAAMEEISLRVMTRELCHRLFQGWENDPDIYADMGRFGAYHYNEAAVNRYFDAKQNDSRVMLAVMKKAAPIGEVQLKQIDREKGECTLSIHMQNDAVKGRGYGTRAEQLALRYAFDVLGLRAVNADTIVKNTRSQHVLEKVGFQYLKEEDGFRYYRLQR